MLKSKAAPNAEHQDERDDPAGAGMGRVGARQCERGIR